MDSWPDMLRRSSRLQSSSPVLTNLHRQLQSHVLIIVGRDFPQHWRHIFGEYRAVCMSVTHLLRTLIAAVSLTRRCRQKTAKMTTINMLPIFRHPLDWGTAMACAECRATLGEASAQQKSKVSARTDVLCKLLGFTYRWRCQA